MTPLLCLAALVPSTLDERVTRLEHRVASLDTAVGAAFLAAVICALWAQNTRRNAWLWFFAGLIFSVFALLVLLYKNSADLDRGRPRPAG